VNLLVIIGEVTAMKEIGFIDAVEEVSKLQMRINDNTR